MEYRITLRSNPRILGVVLIIIALPTFGAVSFTFAPIALAVILVIVGGFFSYNFFKLMRSTLGSRIITGADSIKFDFGKGHVDEFLWSAITHAGEFTEPKGKRSVFIYDEAEDRLITVPNEYESFENMLEEIRSHLTDRFEVVDIASESTINEYLRAQVDPDDEETTD